MALTEGGGNRIIRTFKEEIEESNRAMEICKGMGQIGCFVKCQRGFNTLL